MIGLALKLTTEDWQIHIDIQVIWSITNTGGFSAPEMTHLTANPYLSAGRSRTHNLILENEILVASLLGRVPNYREYIVD